MLINQPFWSFLALRMRLVEAGPEAGTAFTDGKRIVFNREFTDKLTNEQLVMLQAHEVLHPAMGHLWRTPHAADMSLWNVACDNEVNHMLEECNVAANGKGLPAPFPWTTGDLAPEMQDRFKGMAAEPIYQQLLKERINSGGKGNKASTSSQDASGGSEGDGEGDDSGLPQNKSQNGGSTKITHKPSKSGVGEFIKPQESRAKQQEAKQEWEKAVLQAAMCSKQQGDVPAHFKRLVEQIVNPKADWRDLTREFLRERAADDYSWRRPNPRFAYTGLIMPVLDVEKVGTVIFAVDTSGSISDDLLSQFKCEIQNCLDELAPSKVIVICCDDDVQSVHEYVPGETVGDAGRDFSGGGGTVFQPVWNYLSEKLEEPAVACVFLTDMYADFGADPGIPVMWVTPTQNHPAPFGKTVEVL